MSLAALIRKGGLAKIANANPAKAANDGLASEQPLAKLAALALANPTGPEDAPLPDTAAEARAAGALAILAKLPDQPPNVTPAATTIAPDERAPRHADIDAHAELLALVDAVADFHDFNPEQRAEAKEIALADLEAALECFRDLAARIPSIQPATDDRITCNRCVNLVGRKCTKWIEMGAVRGWEPVQLPMRCEQFTPKAGEADQRTGAERWPNLKEVDE